MENQTENKEKIIDDGMVGKHLTFILGNEEYGIEIKYVTEIIGIQSITSLPDMPGYVKGVINLRGKVIPVMDVRLRFNFENRSYDERTCIIVVNLNNLSVGLIVDQVKEVLDIPANQIDSAPKVQKGSESRFINGLGRVNQEIKILLDMTTLIFEKDFEKITSTAA